MERRRRLDRARDDPVGIGIGTADDPSCVDMVREDPPIDESLSTIWKILHRACDRASVRDCRWATVDRNEREIVPADDRDHSVHLCSRRSHCPISVRENGIVRIAIHRDGRLFLVGYEENEEEFLSQMFR